MLRIRIPKWLLSTGLPWGLSATTCRGGLPLRALLGGLLHMACQVPPDPQLLGWSGSTCSPNPSSLPSPLNSQPHSSLPWTPRSAARLKGRHLCRWGSPSPHPLQLAGASTWVQGPGREYFCTGAPVPPHRLLQGCITHHAGVRGGWPPSHPCVLLNARTEQEPLALQHRTPALGSGRCR